MPPKKDLFEECYSGEHKELLSPKQFREQFCRVCANTSCMNSGVGRSRWQHRIDHQVESLLENPQFADVGDPRYKDLAAMPFEDAFQEALRLEISSERGDWEPVTNQDMVSAVGDLVRAPQPKHFEDDLEDVEDVDVVWQGDFEGRKGQSYTVTLALVQGEDSWTCTCPAFVYKTAAREGCKHILEAQREVSMQEVADPGPAPVPPSTATPETAQQPDMAPEPNMETWESMQVSGILPRAKNTRYPTEGMMVDGSPAPRAVEQPATPEPDPWAPAPEKPTNVIPVGGKIVLGGATPKEKK